jgi:hypothetical protein
VFSWIELVKKLPVIGQTKLSTQMNGRLIMALESD